MPQQVPTSNPAPIGGLPSSLTDNSHNLLNSKQETQANHFLDPQNQQIENTTPLVPETGTLQQQVNGQLVSLTTNTAVVTSTTNNKKLNGLKNRIIQRPPPLILDKVSNFYDTTTNETLVVNSNHQTDNNNDNNKPNNNLPIQQIPEKVSISSSSNLTTTIINPNTQPLQATNSNTNQKFWASLNQNAALRYRQTGTNSITTTTTTSQSNQNSSIINDITKSSINSPNNLGADLIITQRNSQSTFTAPNSIFDEINHKPIVQNSQKIGNLIMDQDEDLTSSKPQLDTVVETNNKFNSSFDETALLKQVDVSFNSDNDELARTASENGGNLIGVDNLSSPPPPTLDNIDSQNNTTSNNIDPPTSATRPRSNNPFLVMDDEEAEANSLENNQNNNFHNRPASFIAATNVASFINQRREQQQLEQQSNTTASEQNASFLTSTSNGDPSLSSRHLVQRFQNLRINSGTYQQHMYNPQQVNAEPELDEKDSLVLDKQEKEKFDEAMDAIYGKITNSKQQPSILKTQQHNFDDKSIYGQNKNFVQYDPNINLDSESAVSNTLPSATMQLPNWTEAIYRLNNAILDTSSVAGGAENGKFIYIVESGDIVLELNHVKVSGMTLMEFNELLESKRVHHLSAVQTKHSQGLTIDLKRYLNSTFPKNSQDKKLQDLIRENIYRRTVPCTTRPQRDGEVDKVDYHFLTKEQFVEMNNKGLLLECGMYGGHYYGTMRPFSDVNNSSLYGSLRRRQVAEDMQQPLNPNHPMINKMDVQNVQPIENLYENHESLRMLQMEHQPSAISYQQSVNVVSSDLNVNNQYTLNQRALPPIVNETALNENNTISNNMINIIPETLPHGWERVNDETHGPYYIDHNTQRTQYEQPYEIELTKGAMGFGFTLVEAENGILIVKSIIHGGPAHSNGTIRPGDILLSAVGVPLFGLQHTDIARLFSTFAVGDRVRLTFARSAYVVDSNLVPDEVHFSNGTNGDVSVAVNSAYLDNLNRNTTLAQTPDVLGQQEFDFIPVTLKRGDKGFGFTISDSVAGQKVKKIQNSETCINLKQGDILINLNQQDITKLTHKQVVELLKNCPPNQDASLIIKRKRRFRSKTPMALHSETSEFIHQNPPQRNCKTPSLDGLMLRSSTNNQKSQSFSTSWHTNQMNNAMDNIQSQITPQTGNLMTGASLVMDNQRIPVQENHCSLPVQMNQDFGNQSIYGVNPNNTQYYNQQLNSLPMANNCMYNSLTNPQIQSHQHAIRPPSISNSERLRIDNMGNSIQLSEPSLQQVNFANLYGLNQANQFNNFMNNDKLVMMQMHQPEYQQTIQAIPASTSMHNNDYNQMPLYSNSMNFVTKEATNPNYQYQGSLYDNNLQNNYYANSEEIAQQRNQYNPSYPIQQPTTYNQQQQPQPIYVGADQVGEYENHQIDLERSTTESNWGIRLIGGSEADRAISIGSIVYGGVASKNGKLKPGDEIISINGINVVGATHRHVVELISACSNRATLIIRRNKFAEACEVILERNSDEGFGFVIISKENCALIGRIIEGSPADRCQQLHNKDRIIAVNGRFFSPNMKHPEIVHMIKQCGNTLRLTIIPADCYTVELIKNAQSDNFGFRMRGGSEYGTPLYILQVAPDGIARDLLNRGDQIIQINDIPTVGMTHTQAATIIKYSDPIVKLKLRRNYETPPSLLVDSPRALQKYNEVSSASLVRCTIVN